MSLRQAAQHLAAQGRGGDSVLVHMNPQELQSLRRLASANGTRLTVNPQTGLPEALKLKDLLPAAAGIALGPAGFGLMSSLGAAATVGGLTALTSGSLQKGIMAGLGAYGGSALGEGLMGLGTGAVSQAAGAGLSEEAAQEAVAKKLAETSNLEKLQAGLKYAADKPVDALKGIGGGSALKGAGVLSAAATPFMAGSMVPTVTKMPAGYGDTGYIRPYAYDPYRQTFERIAPVKASTAATMAANGGLMGYAPGGLTEADIVKVKSSVQQALEEQQAKQRRMKEQQGKYTLSGDSLTAYNYLMGQGAYPIKSNAPRTFAPYIDTGRTAEETVIKPPTVPPVTPPKKEEAAVAPTAPIVYTDPYAASGITPGGDSAAPSSPGFGFGTTGTDTGEDGVSAPGFGFGTTGTDTGEDGTGVAADGTATGIASDGTTSSTSTGGDGSGEGIGVAADGTATGIASDGTTSSTSTGGDGSGGEGAATSTGGDGSGGEGAATSTGGDGSGVGGDGGGGGGGGGGCFLTTATVHHMGLDDDGEVMNTLRRFRDTYMVKNKEKRKDVAWYYANAPKIVRKLDNHPNSERLYRNMYKKYIVPAYKAIKEGELDHAYEIYKDGIDYAKKVSGIESKALAPRYGKHGMAGGGLTAFAGGGLGHLGGYSDGGRLLRGPGDGVSDSIPATIGAKRQPARLADGEFVVPARIVSELGNGSTEAGARKLYAMMDRIQAARKKSVGKGKVAVNSRAEKYLPK